MCGDDRIFNAPDKASLYSCNAITLSAGLSSFSILAFAITINRLNPSSGVIVISGDESLTIHLASDVRDGDS
jgi:hypothetical protein